MIDRGVDGHDSVKKPDAREIGLMEKHECWVVGKGAIHTVRSLVSSRVMVGRRGGA